MIKFGKDILDGISCKHPIFLPICSMKKILVYLCFICLHLYADAQNDVAILKGRLTEKDSTATIDDYHLVIPSLKEIYAVDVSGRFEMAALPYGNFTIHIFFQDELLDSFRVAVNDSVIDVGSIVVANPNRNAPVFEENALPSVLLDGDINVAEEEGQTDQQNISILLHSSTNRDPFLNAASFVFSQYGFRPRGYNSTKQQVFINGMLMNDLNSGSPIWTQWSGLNDVLKNPINSYGLEQNQLAVGAVNGATVFGINAADASGLNKFSYSLANRSYNNRTMYTHSSGLNKRNWACTISASRRWAEEGYVSGTSLDAFSGLISIAKVLNSRHLFSFNILATHNRRARAGTALDELYDLAGSHYYNPNWGWQNGEKRNARMSTAAQPFAVMQHQFTPSKKTQINSSVYYQMGSTKSTSLDWYNAIDPRADYYRNLPSFYKETNPFAAQEIEKTLRNHPEQLQIDWARLYAANKANYETLYDLNGVDGDSLSGRRSLYVLGADVEQLRKMGFAVNLLHKHSDKIIWSGGLQAIHQQSVYFRQLEDLLGGDYFLNYNMFAAQQFPANKNYQQNDLNKPDRAILSDEKYRYHYQANFLKGWLWGQQEVNLRKFTLSTSVQLGSSSYQRNGLYKNGLFAEHSYGKSTLKSFINYVVKAGITYKLNGRNYLLLNGFYSADEPSFNNVFIAPRSRNQTIAKPEMQTTQSAEAGYIMHAPKLNIRAIGYATDIKNGLSIQRFYNDEPEYQSFVNFVMQKVNTRNIGTELAVEYALNSMVSLNAVAAIGQAFYTNRPTVSVYNDNDTNLTATSKEVFIKNYYLGVGPQSAYTAGIAYNSKKFWYLKLNANYFERNYVAVNPSRRSVEAAELLSETDSLFGRIFNQEELPAFFTIDISGGKSIKLNKFYSKISYSTSLYLNFGISNLLNNQSIKSGGFEQLRYDFINNNPAKFPNKYMYAPGRTFFINVSVKF